MKTILFQPIILVLFCGSVVAQTNVVCLTKQLHTHSSRGLGWNGKTACLSDNHYLWDNGRNLYIKFVNGSKQLQEQTIVVFKEIEKYANIRFEVVLSGNSHVRIGFNNQQIIATALGTMCNWFPQDEITTTIDSTFSKNKALYETFVLHTMLHMLGIQDETLANSKTFSWHNSNIDNFFTRASVFSMNNINKEEFKEKYKLNYSNTLRYNSSSIMLAPLPNQFLQNGNALKWNLTLSKVDKQYLAVLYPFKNSEHKDTAKTVIQFSNLVIQQSVKKDGYSFYPQFSIATCNKKELYNLMLFIYDEAGNQIPASTDMYNLDNQLGDIVAPYWCVGKQTNINTPALNDIEFFIPNNLLKALLSKQKLLAVFKIYFTNTDFDEGWLFVSKPFAIQ